MSIIREVANLTPISSERVDTNGNIHRYNFGWNLQRTLVHTGEEKISGTVVDKSTVLIQGYDQEMIEESSIELLPPSLQTPDVKISTTQESAVKVGSYYKEGVKKRVYTRIAVSGKNKIIEYATTPYSLTESKEYADAIGKGDGFSPPTPEREAAEGGAIISAANGVITKTIIKG